MASTTPEQSVPAPAAPTLPTRKAQFWENMVTAARTAGAALIGNSVLIWLGFVGAHADKVWIALALGVVFILVGSIPIIVIERENEAIRNPAASEDNGAKGA